MELTTIQMSRGEAAVAFREYRDAVRERHDDELEAIMRGYRELARGNSLIRLGETIEAGGFASVTYSPWRNETTTVPAPKLACVRADERWATYRLGDGSLTFAGYRDEDADKQGVHRPWQHRSRLRRVRVETSVRASVPEGELHAMVPIVPPPLRPKASLSNYHVLWEVDEWTQRRPWPPADPALLRRVAGDLFAVVAVWDLTDLERAVLSARIDVG